MAMRQFTKEWHADPGIEQGKPYQIEIVNWKGESTMCDWNAYSSDRDAAVMLTPFEAFGLYLVALFMLAAIMYGAYSFVMLLVS